MGAQSLAAIEPILDVGRKFTHMLRVSKALIEV